MIVKCIKNKREDLSAELLPNYDNYVNGQEIYMEIGQYFFVFGVSFREDVPWYLILEDETDDYPLPFSSGLFKMVDSSIPNDWHFCNQPFASDIPCIIQKEWTNPLFYGHLLDGEEYAVKKFYEQKKIANNEIKKFLDKEKKKEKGVLPFFRSTPFF
ncbi:hypothetical protein [bacterium endosymbiont of Bathymodiolus sp. 5 South]|uniref:hypothetical protein n=1 Tax=bacterium endosymbiont of Bathymodiolus sp. 5 South TaxID=1181670 RepID=UPI0011199DF8|nr:hypothetical protein [bacterium endosymbiont of Bathymodiolus sp. 5 South]